MLRISSSFWVYFEAAVRSLGILTGYDDLIISLSLMGAVFWEAHGTRKQTALEYLRLIEHHSERETNDDRSVEAYARE